MTSIDLQSKGSVSPMTFIAASLVAKRAAASRAENIARGRELSIRKDALRYLPPK